MPQALRNRVAVPAPVQPHAHDCAQHRDCDCDYAPPYGHDGGCGACAAAAAGDGDAGGVAAAAVVETTSAAGHDVLSPWPSVVRSEPLAQFVYVFNKYF